MIPLKRLTILLGAILLITSCSGERMHCPSHVLRPFSSSISNAESISRIAALEQKYNIILPCDYKNFLIAVNGGFPEYDPSLDREEGTPIIGMFYGIVGNTSLTGADDQCTFESKIELYFNEFRMPKGIIPVATDLGGCLYFIDCNPGDKFGAIGYWDRYAGEENSWMEAINTPEFANFIKFFNKFLTGPLIPNRQ